MDNLVALIPLFPLVAAAVIGIGHLLGLLDGEASEKTTAAIASWAIKLSCLLALILLGADLLGKNTGLFALGQWLASGTLNIQVKFITTGFSVKLAALFCILLFIVIRFSINYMHKEAGFHRFFFILSLFAAAMMVLVLSDNAVGTFIGWEIAGFSSYLLIAYAYDRPVAAANATRVFVANRIGDASFLLGIGFSLAWTHSLDWSQINTLSAQLSPRQASVIAFCFAIAAFAKSAQLPFSPWLARAAEGPTPSSAGFYGAVMVHSGVYLMLLLQPILERAPLIMILVAIVGLLTAVYGFFVGLTQTDVKSSLFFSTTSQLGLMFLECGLGFWQLASWHLCAHAIVRGYLVLTAPSLMHYIRGNPIKPFPSKIANLRWAYIASLQRLWMDQIADRILVRPICRLARDLAYFDDHVVDRAMGIPIPALHTISSLAQLEKQKIDGKLKSQDDDFARGSGLIGNFAHRVASALYWFEDRLVIRGIGKDMINYGRRLGHATNKVEQLLLQPGYLALFVALILLVAL